MKTWVEKQGFSTVLIDKYEEKHGSAESKNHLKVRRFANSYTESIQLKTESDLIKLNDHCDIFISGSDQMWNPEFKAVSGWENYLDFAFEDKKKISYASSFGDHVDYSAPIEDWVKTKLLFSRYDYISVREAAGKEILSKVFKVDAPHVVDPVFLLSAEEYAELMPVSLSAVTQPYLLAYFIITSKEVAEFVKNTAEKLGLRVLFILDADPTTRERNRAGLLSGGISEDCIVDAEIADFVHYFKNAEFVVTDSFHGLCFSTIFERNFFAVLARDKHERLLSLLKMVNLGNRAISIHDSLESRPDLLEAIDYSTVRGTLDKQITESKEWLAQALSSPQKNTSPSFYDLIRQENLLLRDKISYMEWKLEQISDKLKAYDDKISAITTTPPTEGKKGTITSAFSRIFGKE